jgi:uncharacterized protein (TIGR02466 family)
MSLPESPQLSITSAFATPIVETELPECVDLNRRLRALFLRWEGDGERGRSSVPTGVVKVGVYESAFDLFSRPGPEIQALRNFCLNTLGYVIARLNRYGDREMAGLRIHEHSWYHITRDTGYTAQHNHPMASWSGVYCVDPGDAAEPSDTNSGALRFMDARGSAGMYLDSGNAHLERPFGFGALAYFLTAGKLVLFPSHLAHEVAPYFGRRERITVAFNAWVREAGAAGDAPFVRKR